MTEKLQSGRITIQRHAPVGGVPGPYDGWYMTVLLVPLVPARGDQQSFALKAALTPKRGQAAELYIDVVSEKSHQITCRIYAIVNKINVYLSPENTTGAYADAIFTHSTMETLTLRRGSVGEGNVTYFIEQDSPDELGYILGQKLKEPKELEFQASDQDSGEERWAIENV